MDIISFLQNGVSEFKTLDPLLHNLLQKEHQRQQDTLCLVASSNSTPASILSTLAMTIGNVTTDGYPGSRYLPGCELADRIEQLAIDRAKYAFDATHANVQPHSGTSANQSILLKFLKAGDIFMGMDLKSGGHLTHGSKASILGSYFYPVTYGVNTQGWIDYDAVRDIAIKHQPKLIIAGASAYSRLIDYKRFRSIADEVNAYLLADISHISGLIAAREIPNPIDDAHFCTSSTYKQLFGPKGGIILLGKDGPTSCATPNSTLMQQVDRGVSPFFQDSPNLSSIAAKAAALQYATTESYKNIAKNIKMTATWISDALMALGYHVMTNGTDNHLMLIDLAPNGLTGIAAEKALEQCNIIANRNPIPFDKNPPHISGGIRFGTNAIALRGLSYEAIIEMVSLIDNVFKNINESGLSVKMTESIKAKVQNICHDFPIPKY